MSSLNSFYLKLDTLEKIVSTLKKKKAQGIELTISINDDANQYDQNISGWVSQSKEDREAKKERFFVGNGRTFWTDGKIAVPVKGETSGGAQDDTSDDGEDDLPF